MTKEEFRQEMANMGVPSDEIDPIMMELMVTGNTTQAMMTSPYAVRTGLVNNSYDVHERD